MVAEEQCAIEEGREFVSGTGESAKMIQRMVVYNAEMRISVEDPEVTMQAIIDMAVDSGGFVVSSNLYKTNTDREIYRKHISRCGYQPGVWIDHDVDQGAHAQS